MDIKDVGRELDKNADQRGKGFIMWTSATLVVFKQTVKLLVHCNKAY